MYALLLALIYVAFVGLGLPDSLIGAGWPVMQGDLGVPVGFAGILTMIIAAGTILSSLLSERLTHRLGVGLVTAIACAALSIGVAVMAIMTVSQFSQAKADLFMGYDFDYIAAVLVGGIALRGGKGTPLQAALGAVLIALLQNFMLLHGLSAGVRMTTVGLLVIASISLFHILQGRGR